MSDCILGIDVGGTKLLANVYDLTGHRLLTLRCSTGRDTSVEKLLTLVEKTFEDSAAVGRIASVGLGFPGLTDSRRGLVRSSVILDGWHEVAFAERMTSATGVPCFIDNDVNNSARAESYVRGRTDGQDLLYVSIGTGVGGALVLHNELWWGTSGLAGEIGHVVVDRNGPKCRCGSNGCAAVYAAGAEIDRLIGRASEDGEASTALDLGSRLREPTECLGIAIANVLNVMNLPLVVVGGGVARLGPSLVELIEQSARRHAFAEIAGDCRFELSAAGYEAGALGAALLAGLSQPDLRGHGARHGR
jgi:glucokinase